MNIMKTKEYLKLELMVWAINHDFFGYGSSCIKTRHNNTYDVYIDGEHRIVNKKELSKEFDALDVQQKENIVYDYFKEEFKNEDY